MPNFDRLRTEAVYNTRAVVQKTGVPADTFRAWERRYGLPIPCRTPGNQRLYSERDMATISWLRDQTVDGLTISQAVALFRTELCVDCPEETDEAVSMLEMIGWIEDEAPPHALRRLAESRPGGATGQTSESRQLPRRLFEQVVDALTVFDDGAAERVIEEALAILPVDQICVQVLEPALAEVGARWQRQEVGVGVEHFASGFVLRKLGTLFNLSQPHIGRGPIVAACVEGEHHEIGLFLTALFLSKGGYRVVYLGPNLPISDLCTAVSALDPSLVLLSASSESSAATLIDTVRALRAQSVRDESTTQQPLIAYGGSIFARNPELKMRIDADFLSCRACEATRVVDRLLAELPEQAPLNRQ